jgi:transcriptional regulator with XRE-family HTH domain
VTQAETVASMTGGRTPEAAEWLRWFGERLRQVRLRQGVSQLQLSASAVLSQSFVSDVEQGRRNVSLVTIRRLADALNVDPRELLAPVEV